VEEVSANPSKSNHRNVRIFKRLIDNWLLGCVIGRLGKWQQYGSLHHSSTPILPSPIHANRACHHSNNSPPPQHPVGKSRLLNLNQGCSRRLRAAAWSVFPAQPPMLAKRAEMHPHGRLIQESSWNQARCCYIGESNDHESCEVQFLGCAVPLAGSLNRCVGELYWY
jgi:hypothetical protein